MISDFVWGAVSSATLLLAGAPAVYMLLQHRRERAIASLMKELAERHAAALAAKEADLLAELLAGRRDAQADQRVARLAAALGAAAVLGTYVDERA